jgi:UDP-N-acetylglucosamine 4,6-dehydratase/5-epimerase
VNNSYLITGGTGTFGHAAVRQLLSEDHFGPTGYRAERIIIFSRDEMKQEAMARRFAPLDPEGRLRFFLGDVRDKERLKLALRDVDFVIHAAALKIVPAGEYNPFEFVETNIQGTRNVISAALEMHTRRVLLISTDKAVQPINLYGASKLVAEKMIIAANNLAAWREPYFSVCRYGNVTGSRGSVFELWKQQLAASQPLSLTAPQATRFWITKPEAATFALDVLERKMAHNGGEIFVPKMAAYNIRDLCTAFWTDNEVPQDLQEFHKTGLRPGEKMHEDIVAPHEQAVAHKHFYRISQDRTSCPVGDSLPLGYNLTSANSMQRLSIEELTELIKNLGE